MPRLCCCSSFQTSRGLPNLCPGNLCWHYLSLRTPFICTLVSQPCFLAPPFSFFEPPLIKFHRHLSLFRKLRWNILFMTHIFPISLWIPILLPLILSNLFIRFENPYRFIYYFLSIAGCNLLDCSLLSSFHGKEAGQNEICRWGKLRT